MKKKTIISSGITALLGGAALFTIDQMYRFVFVYPQKKRKDPKEIPETRLSVLQKSELQASLWAMEETPWEKLSITADDGLALHGRYYEGEKGAPLILFFHGYHGSFYWDGYGIFKICREMGYHLIMVHQRAHGDSTASTLTFGIRESKDCQRWAEYAAGRFGKKTDIILAGVSMGAATVMMASALPLPQNVCGVIEDCGYTTTEDIIRNTMKGMNIPVKPLYPFVRLGARLFGHFDPRDGSPLQAVKKTKLPMLFIHGDKDTFVPYPMCDILYQACRSKKWKVTIKGAEHAVSSMVDYDRYRGAIVNFVRYCRKFH